MAKCITLPLPCREKQTVAKAGVSPFSYKIFQNISGVAPALWDNHLPENHFFLSREYLLSLEKTTGNEVRYRYLIIELNGIPAGFGFFQIITFRGSNVEAGVAPSMSDFFAYAGYAFKKAIVNVVNKISMNLLVSGNTFVTGDYGFYFTTYLKNSGQALTAVKDGIQKIIAEEKDKISGVLIKDFYENQKSAWENLKDDGYLEFRVNPNMILEVQQSWNTFENYLSSMSSKYRTRMKKALKKSAELEIREMDTAEMERRITEMDNLYGQVVNEADFKLAKLDIRYLLRLKELRGECFGVLGFFKNNELLTFISYCEHDGELVAGFMGMNRLQNKEHDLYLNVLLQLARLGIERKTNRVIYGRTAMEIKSSVGALPQPMYLYVRHRSAAVNFIIRRVVRYLSREPEWTLRTPFKN